MRILTMKTGQYSKKDVLWVRHLVYFAATDKRLHAFTLPLLYRRMMNVLSFRSQNCFQYRAMDIYRRDLEVIGAIYATQGTSGYDERTLSRVKLLQTVYRELTRHDEKFNVDSLFFKTMGEIPVGIKEISNDELYALVIKGYERMAVKPS